MAYAWRRRGESARAEQANALSSEIPRLFLLDQERYGSPRVQRLLSGGGCSVSPRRVGQLMRLSELGTKAVRGCRAKAKVRQLYDRHPNRLWKVQVHRPNQVWVGDITYLKVAGRWHYLAIVMDQYSRRILALDADQGAHRGGHLCHARRRARQRPARGVIFHSDRGSE